MKDRRGMSTVAGSAGRSSGPDTLSMRMSTSSAKTAAAVVVNVSEGDSVVVGSPK